MPFSDPITDNWIYDLRDTHRDDFEIVRDLGAETARGPQMSHETFGRRHYFQMDDTSKFEATEADRAGNRHFAVLRVDLETSNISGDLFFDIHRRDWVMSFKSEVIFKSKFPNKSCDFVVVADVYSPTSSHNDRDDQAKAIIAFKYDNTLNENGDYQLKACRIIVRCNEASHILDLTKREDEPRPDLVSKNYRHISLQTILDSRLRQDGLLDFTNFVLGDGNKKVTETLLADDQSILVKKNSAFNRAPCFEATGSDPVDILTQYQYSDDAFAFSVLLTSAEPSNNAYGDTPGLEGGVVRHKSRFGTIIYVKKLLNDYSANYGWTVESHPEELAVRVRHIIIHELGHMLNLPHPWQRDLFLTPSIPSNPAAPSWLNYGTLYPMGSFMTHSRNWKISQEAKLNPMSAEDVEKRRVELQVKDVIRTRKELAKFDFTKDEKAWLRHAPFDQIATGHSSFSDNYAKRQTLKAPTLARVRPGDAVKKPQLRLTLSGHQTPGGRIQLGLYPQEAEGSKVQPITGDVSFLKSLLPDGHTPPQFMFQSGALQLLCRADFDDEENVDQSRPVIELKAAALPFDSCYLPHDGFEGGPVRTNLAVELMETSKKTTTSEDGEELYFRSLPLIFPKFRKIDNANRNKFTLQTVFYPRDGLPFFSNQVRIEFVNQVSPLTPELVSIIQNPKLSLLWELLIIPGELPVRDFSMNCRLVKGCKQRTFETLVDDIANISEPTEHKVALTWVRLLKAMLVINTPPKNILNDDVLQDLDLNPLYLSQVLNALPARFQQNIF